MKHLAEVACNFRGIMYLEATLKPNKYRKQSGYGSLLRAIYKIWRNVPPVEAGPVVLYFCFIPVSAILRRLFELFTTGFMSYTLSFANIDSCSEFPIAYFRILYRITFLEAMKLVK